MRTFLPLLAVALVACVRNPATGKLELNLVSESQEVELGKQAKVEAEQAYGVYKEKSELNSYVDGVGKALAAHSDRPNLPYSYEIIDDSSVNAFALPGGPIFITRGILGHLNSEVQARQEVHVQHLQQIADVAWVFQQELETVLVKMADQLTQAFAIEHD